MALLTQGNRDVKGVQGDWGVIWHPHIIHKEAQGTTRNIKEAMYIRANDPSLNRNLGKYQLPHVWDQVLIDTPALKLK